MSEIQAPKTVAPDGPIERDQGISFNLYAQILQGYTYFSSVPAPVAVSSQSYAPVLSDFAASGLWGAGGNVADQWTKMQYCMNLFEMWRWKNIKWRWIPRWSQHVRPVVTGGAGSGFLVYPGSTANADAPQDQTGYWDPISITFKPDFNDTVTRATFNELYQAQKDPASRTWKSDQAYEMNYAPRTQVLTVNGFNFEGASYGIGGGGTGIYTNYDANQPEKLPWRSTKVSTQSGSSNNLVLDINSFVLGHKIWYSNPYAQGTPPSGPIIATIGTWCITYELEFRQMDDRALVALTTLTDPGEENERKRRKLQGEHVAMMPELNWKAAGSALAKKDQAIRNTAGGTALPERPPKEVTLLTPEGSPAPQTLESHLLGTGQLAGPPHTPSGTPQPGRYGGTGPAAGGVRGTRS